MQNFKTHLFKTFSGLLVAGLILTGCGTKEAAAPQASSGESTQQNSEAQPAAALMIERKVHTETFRDDNDGTVLLTLKITYPQIKNPNNNTGISKINEYYGIQFDDFISNALADALEMAKADKEAAQNNGFEFHPHAYEREAEIYYSGNNLLSVVNLQYENTGGAHPNSCWLSETFDVKSGKKLALADILGVSQEQALEKVYQTVLEQIKRTEGTDDFIYQDDYQENVRKSFSEDDFVLTNNSLMFYYQPYAIAPYAAGIPKFKIPYSELKSPALKISEQPNNQSERDVYVQAGRLIDRNREAYFEIFGLSMLKMDIPEDRAETEVLFPVIDSRFPSYTDFEQFVRSTFIKNEADSLLNSGKYRNVDGKLYGDMSKDAGGGYYVNWNDYSYVLEDITDSSASLKIVTKEDSPEGNKDVTITGKMKKKDDAWLLEKMIY